MEGNIFFRLISALLSNLDRGPRNFIILEPRLDAKSIPINRHIIIHKQRKKASIILMVYLNNEFIISNFNFS